MRKLVLVVGLVLMASGAQAASYLDIFGTVHDPIQNPSGENYPYSGPNLEPGVVAPGANLFQAFLTNANLNNADLSGALLGQAFLTGANLSNATLSGANLVFTYLYNANLDGAKLDSAILSAVNMGGASLVNADLSYAKLDSASLGGVDLDFANLSGANLAGAYLLNVDLTGANLSGANLAGAFGLGTTAGIPYYDALTDFTGALTAGLGSALFDPVAAGWVLVPEPNTALLLGIGLAGIAAKRRPRR